ncbi:PsbP-related protein [Methanobrevibacter sp.]|uniref:PsbP-related protein n=1 Tax=Methanobrevibacter sp. TaxID=66852 RepID=UPI0038906D66
MKSNVLKYVISIMLCLLFIGCIVTSVNADDSSDLTMLSLSKGGIVINYPSDWGYSQATSQYSIMSISKLDSIDALGVGQVNINIEKKPLEGDFYTFVNDTYKSMSKDSSFELISSGEVTLKDMAALEYIYTSSQNDTTVKEHKAVWFEKGGQAYVLLYSAPLDQFESNLYVFDYILTDIQIN